MNLTQLSCFEIAFIFILQVNDVLDNAHIIIIGMPLYKFNNFFLNISPRKILSIQTAYNASPNGRNIYSMHDAYEKAIESFRTDILLK